jgi:hypothetical protein
MYRERLAAECDFDVHKIFERARKEQAASNATIVHYSKEADVPAMVSSAVKGE